MEHILFRFFFLRK